MTNKHYKESNYSQSAKQSDNKQNKQSPHNGRGRNLTEEERRKGGEHSHRVK